MKSIMIALTLSLAAAPGWLARAQSYQPQGVALNKACYDAANAKPPIWKQQNIPADTIELRYQRELALCSGASADASAFVASINFDLARFARRYLAGGMTSSLYIALSRDRGRKLRHGLRDTAWLSAYAAGPDADGDLVPDSRDQCPTSAPESPTADNGCPSTEPLPAAPDPALLKRLTAKAGMMMDPDCANAPVPRVAAPYRAGYELITGNYLLGVLHQNNQPNHCMVAYEVRLTYSARKVGSAPPTLTLGAVYDRSESKNTSNTAAYYMLFRNDQGSAGPKKALWDLARQYGRYKMTVRVMNGAGMSSGWSEPVDLPAALWRPLKVQ
ncbi:MAG: hypothetical protein R2729_17120 [Bryobacteraceae bacterium]